MSRRNIASTPAKTSRPGPQHGAALVVATLAALLLGPAALADTSETGAVPVVLDAQLSGREIYDRVVANRFRSFQQESRLVSSDRAGRAQESRFEMKWQDFRDVDDGAERLVQSKTLVRYSHPFDLRHAGYLILMNDGRANDQFVYYPSRRRVARVNLRSEAVYGTDFSFEDVVPREAEDYHSERLPNSRISGVDVFVVDLTPKRHLNSEYSRIRVYVDTQRSVVIHARYWDAATVEIKQMLVDPERIEEFDGVFVPMHSTMRNLQHESQTELIVSELAPNPGFDADTWDLRRLEGH